MGTISSRGSRSARGDNVHVKGALRLFEPSQGRGGVQGVCAGRLRVAVAGIATGPKAAQHQRPAVIELIDYKAEPDSGAKRRSDDSGPGSSCRRTPDDRATLPGHHRAGRRPFGDTVALDHTVDRRDLGSVAKAKGHTQLSESARDEWAARGSEEAPELTGLAGSRAAATG